MEQVGRRGEEEGPVVSLKELQLLASKGDMLEYKIARVVAQLKVSTYVPLFQFHIVGSTTARFTLSLFVSCSFAFL